MSLTRCIGVARSGCPNNRCRYRAPGAAAASAPLPSAPVEDGYAGAGDLGAKSVAKHVAIRDRMSERERMPTDLSVDVGGVTLAVWSWLAEASSGCSPVVLLPATAETAEDWDIVASALCSSRTVYAVNLRGHGPSDWPGTYSIGLMAEDVTRLLDAGLDRAPVDLVGHSLGGLLTCQVAAARPELVRRLVLEDVGLLQPRPADPPPEPAGVLPFDWRVVEQVRPEIDNFDPGWAGVVASIAAPTLCGGWRRTQSYSTGGDSRPGPPRSERSDGHRRRWSPRARDGARRVHPPAGELPGHLTPTTRRPGYDLLTASPTSRTPIPI